MVGRGRASGVSLSWLRGGRNGLAGTDGVCEDGRGVAYALGWQGTLGDGRIDGAVGALTGRRGRRDALRDADDARGAGV